MSTLPITNSGQTVLVSDDLFDVLSRSQWRLSSNGIAVARLRPAVSVPCRGRASGNPLRTA